MDYKDFEDSELREVKIDGADVYDGVLLHVKKDRVRLPNGKTSVREYIRHIGAVCVVPVTDDGKVIVEHQFRYPMDEVIVEIPAGKLDSRSEDIEAAARRELLEETGITAGKMIYMGQFVPTCAYSNESIHMYLAKNLTFGDRKLDEDEFLNVSSVPLDDLVADILSGKIKDGKTQAAVLKAYLMLKGM